MSCKCASAPDLDLILHCLYSMIVLFFFEIHKRTDNMQYYKIIQTMYNVLQNCTNKYASYSMTSQANTG